MTANRTQLALWLLVVAVVLLTGSLIGVAMWNIDRCAPIFVISPKPAQQAMARPWSAYPNPIPPRRIWRV